MDYKISSIAFFFFACLNLQAFSPGKWSHIDRFIVPNDKKKPMREVVKNARGEVIYSAHYFYNSDGLISEEKYYNANNKSEGGVIYKYKDKKLAEEALYDKKGNAKEKKEFLYDDKGDLEKMIVKSASGKPQVYYTLQKGPKKELFFVDITWAKVRDQEFYTIRSDMDSDYIFYLDILNTSREKVGTTKYMYDRKGNLIGRLNIQGKRMRQQNIRYDKVGNITNLLFHVKRGKKWFKVKEHQLLYGNKRDTVGKEK
ncbi:MAG: hypothetical protein AAF518_00760 [Spirochaetota bacterium]